MKKCKKSGFSKSIQHIWHDLNFSYDVTALPQENELRFFECKALFDNAEFLVKLTEFEVENAVFITGHRLIPFIKGNSSLVHFFEKDTKEIVDSKYIKMPLCDLMRYYSLSDEYENMLWNLKEFMGEEDWLDCDLPEIVTVYCYDLSSFMAKNKFAPGDYIKLHTKYGKSRYGIPRECYIEHFLVSRVPSNTAKNGNWKSKFESGLAQAINYQKERGGEFYNHDLIAAAFYYGGESLLKNPLGSWLDVLYESDKFSLQYVGGRQFMWDRSSLQNHMHNELERDAAVQLIGLEYLNFPALTALMGLRMYEYNTLGEMLYITCSGGTRRDARKYCYDARFAKCPPEFRKRFDKMIARIWRRAKRWKSPSRCSAEIMKCSKDMMELKNQILEYICKLEKLEIAPEKLCSPEFVILEKLLSDVYGYFNDFTIYPFDESLKKTAKAIPKIASRLDITIRQLEKKFMSKPSAVSASKPE
ncbi:MAG: hypothetical protein KAS17_02395 [Victivallaceae bacterium]|nr:hypothetical protein [Victivallaceae bacterium]